MVLYNILQYCCNVLYNMYKMSNLNNAEDLYCVVLLCMIAQYSTGM